MGTFGTIQGAIESIGRSSALIAESRSWLDEYYRSRPTPGQKPASQAPPLICLFCRRLRHDAQTLELDKTEVAAFAADHPHIDIEGQLAGFGVCDDCVENHHGGRRRVVFVVNNSLPN